VWQPPELSRRGHRALGVASAVADLPAVFYSDLVRSPFPPLFAIRMTRLYYTHYFRVYLIACLVLELDHPPLYLPHDRLHPASD